MQTKTSHRDQGIIGLGVLLMMTVALVASEAHDSFLSSNAAPDQTPVPRDATLLMDMTPPGRDVAIHGTIREIGVVPLMIESRLDLDWTPDEALIEKYNRPGF